MQISETTDRLTIRDVPRGTWAFGLVFVASGLFVLIGVPGSADWGHLVAWERLAVLAIGVGHLAGGLHVTTSASATETELDRGRSSGTQDIRPFWPTMRREHTTFALSDAQDVEIVRGSDNDGDPTFRLRLWLRDSRKLWLQAQPTRGEGLVLEAAVRVRRFLGLAAATPNL